MRPQKYIDLAERFAHRIRKGDYHLHELPAERDLAVEAGVSYTTARKAVQRLVDDGLLYRKPNGRAAVRPIEDGSQPVAPTQMALLTPAWESASNAGWRAALAQIGEHQHFSSRSVLYTHWDDPAVLYTIERFNGTFLIPEPEPPPASLLQTLRESGRPLVVLDEDWSAHGIRSLRMNGPIFVHRILEHLAGLGHRKIDCFNVQPGSMPAIRQWRVWLASQGLEGQLIDEPVQPYGDPLPAAYEVINRHLRDGTFHSKALFCTTEPAAAGAMSALLDHGVRPGHDVAVGTTDGGARTAFCNPPLTGVGDVDREAYMRICLDWMLGRAEQAWAGPLLLQPDDARVIVRQSTVPDSQNVRRMK